MTHNIISHPFVHPSKEKGEKKHKFKNTLAICAESRVTETRDSQLRSLSDDDDDALSVLFVTVFNITNHNNQYHALNAT